MGQPASYWDEGLEICSDAIFRLPQLSGKNLMSTSPLYRLVAQPDKLKRIAATAFTMPAPLKPVDDHDVAQPVLMRNESENSLFNEIIHDLIDISSEVEEETEAEPKTPPQELPQSHHQLSRTLLQLAKKLLWLTIQLL